MEIKQWFRNKIAALSIALSNVEKNFLSQKSSEDTDELKKEQRHLQGTLADSLVRGEVTQEVKNLRWRIYKIIKKTKGVKLLYDKTDENGNNYYNSKKTNDNLLLKKIKLDEFDTFPLEMVVKNNEITLNSVDSINEFIKEYEESIKGENEFGDIIVKHGEINSIEYFATIKGEKPVKIYREVPSKINIENYANKLNIRTINDDEKLIEFYITKYPNEYNKNSQLLIKEIQKIINKKVLNSTILDIKNIEFITYDVIGADDLLYFNYEVISFDKIIEFDGHYIIKFKCKVLNSGDDILLDYKEDELEKKYENKEKK